MIPSETQKRGTLHYYILYDWSRGILHRWPVFLASALIFGFAGLQCCDSYATLRMSGEITALPSFLDAWIYAFKGMAVFNPLSNQPFNIPALWLLIEIFIAYMVSSYPYTDLDGVGLQVLVRSQKRWHWWFGKCIWNISSIVLFYAIGAISLLLVVLLKGGGGLTLHPEILDIWEMQMQSPAGSWKIMVFLLPLLMSLALSMLQMAAMFFVKPMMSFAAVVAVLVCSAFFNTPFLIGNHAMIMRYALFTPGGIEPLPAIAIDTGLFLAALLVGKLRFDRYDIY